MPFLISLVIASIFAALLSGLATGYIETGSPSFQFSAWHMLAGTGSSLIALSIYALMSREKGMDTKSFAPNARPAQDGRQSGTVKWFNPKKGFGFISCSNGDEIFVHYRSIEGTGRRILREGESVTFLIVQSDKGPQAEDVRSES